VAALRARRLRSVLSALGVAIGIAAMVAVVGVSASSRADLLARLDRLGTNLLRAAPASDVHGRQTQLPPEARDFPVAARMLALLGVPAIRLMTNNPAKVAALEAEGVEVAERVPHQLPPGPHNARYLATKRDRTGHLL